MRNVFRFAILILVIAGLSGCAAGAPRDIQAEALVAQSTATVELFKSRQKDSTQLFTAALRDAKGIMIFPDIFEMAVGIGGQGGSGVMLSREASGAWGYPAFFRLSGGSLGVQLGAQSTEVIFLLMTDEAVRKVVESPTQFSIGAQATFGEIGGGGSSATNIKGADIVGFTKGAGIFVGAALGSAYVSSLQALNQAYYRNAAATPQAIIIDHQVSNPDADRLRQALIVQ